MSKNLQLKVLVHLIHQLSSYLQLNVISNLNLSKYLINNS